MTRMYVVAGRPCAVCDAPVTDAARALACPACAVQFHRRCLADRRSCARCGADLVASAKAEADARADEAARTVRRGRAIVRGVTAVLGTLAVTAIVFQIFVVQVGLGGIVGNALTLFLLHAMHRGSRGATRAIMWLSGAGGALAIALGATLGPARSFAHVLYALGALHVGVAVVMGASAELWRYVDHLRDDAAGPVR